MLFDLQFFSEGATESVTSEQETGAGVYSDAGNDTENASKSEDFEKLIRGEYKEEYSRRVSQIVKNRLKNAKANEEKLSALEKKVEELKKDKSEEEKEEDVSEIQGEADLPQKKDEGIEADTQTDAVNTDTEENEGENPEISEEEIEILAGEIVKTKEIYPNFDLKRELRNPEFRSLISIPGMDMKKAFEISHHEQIISSAMQYAATAAQNKLALSTASGMQRPNEAVQENTSCVIIENVPAGLTKAQRADIKKRVRRGEKIIW